MEAEFLAAVLTAKHAKCLWSMLKDLGFTQHEPTPIYFDNKSAINMIKVLVPTDRSRHIDIQLIDIQDWKDAGDITMAHIPGIINPSDDLTKPLVGSCTSVNVVSMFYLFTYTKYICACMYILICKLLIKVIYFCYDLLPATAYLISTVCFNQQRVSDDGHMTHSMQ